MFFFFFKQKTAYDMRISDWSSDVCSSDLPDCARQVIDLWRPWIQSKVGQDLQDLDHLIGNQDAFAKASRQLIADLDLDIGEEGMRAEEHTSELQSLMRISYDVSGLNKERHERLSLSTYEHHTEHNTLMYLTFSDYYI